MLKELLDRVWGLAQSNLLPQEVDVGDPRARHYLVGKEHVKVHRPTPVRKHTVQTLEGIFEACDRWGGEGVLWHNRQNVVLVIDDDDRRDIVVMPLVVSEVFTLINKLGDQAMDQATFVRLLKNQLNGYVPDSLRPVISKIEIASSAGQKNEINPGRERGSREFAVDVVGGEMPEFIPATVPVYSNAGLRNNVPIRLSLDVTLPPQQVTFRVAPLPDQIEMAWQAAQAELHNLLVSRAKIEVFEGQP